MNAFSKQNFEDGKILLFNKEIGWTSFDVVKKVKNLIRQAYQIKKIKVEGEAGGNLVKVILSGDYELKSIIISDAAKRESQEIINDLIIAAYNNAKENLKKKSADELSKVTGGLNLPLDFKLPF